MYPELVKLSRQLKYGDRMGMEVAIVLGPDERAQGKAAVKDLRTGEQKIIPISEIEGNIRALIHL